MRPRSPWLLVSFVAGLVACAAEPKGGEPETLDDALSQGDFDATVRHLTALPWLPWAYTADGCYARAEYYSMLLATRRVPTNHLYVVASPGTALGGQWRWHVAPLVTKDSDREHLYVLDPVYDTTRALTNVEWVAHQGFEDPAAYRYPSLHVHPGNSYAVPDDVVLPLESPGKPEVAKYKEPTFVAMPSFRMGHVDEACETMHVYIDWEPDTTASEKRDKHRSLAGETARIVAELAALGKIDGDPASLGSRCTDPDTR
jgi:hypothetical protein